MTVHAPKERVDQLIGRRIETLCGRKVFPVLYADPAHLLMVVAHQHGEQGSGWGDFCQQCRRVAERLECTCTIQPAINLPEPVDAAHWWDPECPVHLTDPNEG